MTPSHPVCYECAFYLGLKKHKFICKSFPTGIPDKIIMQGDKHLKILGGEKKDKNGNHILFTKREL